MVLFIVYAIHIDIMLALLYIEKLVVPKPFIVYNALSYYSLYINNPLLNKTLQWGHHINDAVKFIIDERPSSWFNGEKCQMASSYWILIILNFYLKVQTSLLILMRRWRRGERVDIKSVFWNDPCRFLVNVGMHEIIIINK